MNNSILLNLLYDPKAVTVLLITVGVFTMGFRKWKTVGGSNDYILPIAFGVLILYIIDFVLVDVMFNGTAMRLQLLRSFLNVELFTLLFFAFLIAKQIRNGNYVFFAMALILLVPNPLQNWLFYTVIGRFEALYVFYAAVFVYELFERPIGVVMGKLSALLGNRSFLPLSTKSADRMHHFFQYPVTLSVFLVILVAFLSTPLLSPVKPYVKSILGVQLQKTGGMSKKESLFQDIVKFTNEKITGNNALLLLPFYYDDFEFYTKHKVFINSSTILYSVQNQKPFFVQQFQHIFEKDLNYSIEKLRSGGSWDEMWKNVNEKLILKWRKEYGITHVIRENELNLDLPVIYKNRQYAVYDLRL